MSDGFNIQRIDTTSKYKFEKSKNYSVIKYETQKDMWNKYGFKIDNDLCVVDFKYFNLDVGKTFLLGFLNWEEYETLCNSYKTWKDEQRKTLLQELKDEKPNQYSYKDIISLKIGAGENVLIGVIAPKNKGAGYNDFNSILAPDSDYFKYFKNHVEFKPEFLDFTKNVDEFQQALSDLINDESIDMIAIVRGGGWLSLPVLDDIYIAKLITSANKPVILGVGHVGDKTLCDNFVSYCFDTPSLAAVGIRDVFLPKVSL